LSAYQFSGDNPIWMIELGGLEGVPSQLLPNNMWTTAIDATSIDYKNPIMNDIREMRLIPLSSGEYMAAPRWYGEITEWEPNIFANIEMWMSSPPKDVGELLVKIGAKIGYGTLSAPYSLITGKTPAGFHLTPKEKMDAFVDFAPGMVAPMVSKGLQLSKVTKGGLEGYNEVVKTLKEEGKLKRIIKETPQGKKWQSTVSEIYHTWNKKGKEVQESFQTFHGMRETTSATFTGMETTKEAFSNIEQTEQNQTEQN